MKEDLRFSNYKQWALPEGAKARLGTGYLTGKIVYSPDGTQLVVPKSSGIWVYDASTLEIIDFIREYRAFNSSAIRNDQWSKLSELIEVNNAVGFGSEGKLFAVRVIVPRFTSAAGTLQAYTLQIWTRETEQSKRISIEGPRTMGGSMVFSPDGNTLAGSEGGTIYQPNPIQPKALSSFQI